MFNRSNNTANHTIIPELHPCSNWTQITCNLLAHGYYELVFTDPFADSIANNTVLPCSPGDCKQDTFDDPETQRNLSFLVIALGLTAVVSMLAYMKCMKRNTDGYVPIKESYLPLTANNINNHSRQQQKKAFEGDLDAEFGSGYGSESDTNTSEGSHSRNSSPKSRRLSTSTER